jgi:DNA-binding MarR family transcriptional regulator
MGMSERSGSPVTIEVIEAHVRALLERMPMAPPEWAHHDLTFGQLRLLFVLGGFGPISIGQLAQMLNVTDATASELVDRVERRGLAIRSHRTDDRRVVECRLSDAGAGLLAEIQGARRDAMRHVLAVLTDQELAQFDHLLQVIAERLSTAASSFASPEGETRVHSTTTRTSPMADAGRGPA